MGKSRDVRRPRALRFAIAISSALAVSASMAPTAAAAEGTVLFEGAPDAVPGSYIVALKDKAEQTGPLQGITSLVQDLADRYAGTITHTFTDALSGFAGTMSATEARQLAADPNVEYVQQNRKVHTLAVQDNPPSYGLDRIDQRDLPLDSKYNYATDAANVNAYVVDTGIRTTHATFGDRATFGVNTTGDGQDTDCNGHGTHVAGTVGGTEFGVAKGVKLTAVKVLSCDGSGTTAQVAEGIDWVTKNAKKPAVVNMSLGSSAPDPTIDGAVRDSIASGLTYAVASGNSSADACQASPAGVREAITVNASDKQDGKAYYSNFGECSDVFAPGDQITSSWNTGDDATNTISGTSMASPHVAGAAALYLAENPQAAPAAVETALKESATKDKIGSPGAGSPNLLLHTGSAANQPPPAPEKCAPLNSDARKEIADEKTTTSKINVANCAGKAGAESRVAVNIEHSYRGDLVLDLVAPDGTEYNLLDRDGGATDNVDQVFTRDLSAENANGGWTLRVNDTASLDTGALNSWTLNL